MTWHCSVKNHLVTQNEFRLCNMGCPTVHIQRLPNRFNRDERTHASRIIHIFKMICDTIAICRSFWIDDRNRCQQRQLDSHLKLRSGGIRKSIGNQHPPHEHWHYNRGMFSIAISCWRGPSDYCLNIIAFSTFYVSPSRLFTRVLLLSRELSLV